MSQPEATFKRAMVQAFKRLYPAGFHIAAKGVVVSGLPDLRFAVAGVGAAWVEAKVAPNRESAVQRALIDRMAKAGERVRTVTLDRDSGTILVQPQGLPLCSFDRKLLSTTSFWETLLK